MYGQPISFSAHRTRIQEPEFINLGSLENQPLPPNPQPSYSTFSAPSRGRESKFLKDCASIYPLPLTIGLGLSLQTLHQIIALSNPAGTIFHNVYRYNSVIDRPWFAFFIIINVLIIFFLVICGLVVMAGAIAEKKRNRLCRATMVLIGSWWLCGPLMLFILTCMTSQPLPVMRIEVAKYCSQQTMKPPMMSALVVSHQPSEGVKEVWITNRQGREISLWGITPINPRRGYTVKVNRMPDSNKWTRNTGRVWELVVEYKPYAVEYTDDDLIIASYIVNVTISPSVSPPPRDRFITASLSGTVEDPEALMFDDKKHEQTFPLLAPPLIARVEKNKRNKYVEQGEDYGTMLNWHEYERGMGKWCVKWSIDELLANPERLGSLAVVAGWIAGEEDVL